LRSEQHVAMKKGRLTTTADAAAAIIRVNKAGENVFIVFIWDLGDSAEGREITDRRKLDVERPALSFVFMVFVTSISKDGSAPVVYTQTSGWGAFGVLPVQVSN
jgi:hypothetical protein